MATTKHTPGPWTTGSDGERRGHVIANSEGIEVGLFLASSPTQGGEAGTGYADAALIAAAPDMLEALQRLAVILKDYRKVSSQAMRAKLLIQETLEKVQAV